MHEDRTPVAALAAFAVEAGLRNIRNPVGQGRQPASEPDMDICPVPMHCLKDGGRVVFLQSFADQERTLGTDVAQSHAAFAPDRDCVFVVRILLACAQLDQIARRAEHTRLSLSIYPRLEIYADKGMVSSLSLPFPHASQESCHLDSKCSLIRCHLLEGLARGEYDAVAALVIDPLGQRRERGGAELARVPDIVPRMGRGLLDILDKRVVDLLRPPVAVLGNMREGADRRRHLNLPLFACPLQYRNHANVSASM